MCKGAVNYRSSIVDGVYSAFLPNLYTDYKTYDAYGPTWDPTQPEVLHVCLDISSGSEMAGNRYAPLSPHSFISNISLTKHQAIAAFENVHLRISAGVG